MRILPSSLTDLMDETYRAGKSPLSDQNSGTGGCHATVTNDLGLAFDKGGRMAFREKLRDRAQRFLEPGETIEQAFPAQAVHPWMLTGFGILVFSKPRDIVVTDRSILVFRQAKFSVTPKRMLERLPRQTQLGPFNGRGSWGRIELNGQKLWIRRRFQADVKSADAALDTLGKTSSSHPAETTR